MPHRRGPTPFRPLSSQPKPRTALAQQERRLRELEAEETAQDALRFARDIRRREALEDAGAQLGELHHPDRAVPDPEDPWEDLAPRPDDGLDNVNANYLDGEPNDPILLNLHEQAKQIRRQRHIDNWLALYDELFDAYLQGKHQTNDWSLSEWGKDSQPPCNCGAGLVREREVVLVDLHGMSFYCTTL